MKSTEKDVSTRTLTRREFVRGTIGLLFAVTCGELWVGQGSELAYQLEKNPFRLKPRKSTVLFSKIIDPDTGMTIIGGGALINQFNILTVAHLGADKEFSFAQGDDYVQSYHEGRQIVGGIEDVIVHPDLDLSIVHLRCPILSGSYAQIGNRPVEVGEKPLSLSSVWDLKRTEIFAGEIASLEDIDQFGTKHSPKTILVANNSASDQPGKSGGSLFNEDQDELIGICSGRRTSFLTFYNPRSYYVNLTEPRVYGWIMENLKS